MLARDFTVFFKDPATGEELSAQDVSVLDIQDLMNRSEFCNVVLGGNSFSAPPPVGRRGEVPPHAMCCCDAMELSVTAKALMDMDEHKFLLRQAQ